SQAHSVPLTAARSHRAASQCQGVTDRAVPGHRLDSARPPPVPHADTPPAALPDRCSHSVAHGRAVAGWPRPVPAHLRPASLASLPPGLLPPPWLFPPPAPPPDSGGSRFLAFSPNTKVFSRLRLNFASRKAKSSQK